MIKSQKEGISCASVCALCLLSWHLTPLKRAWFHLVCNSHQVFIHIDKIPLGDLCMLNSLSCSSVSPYESFSIIFMAFCWIHSSVFMTLLSWRELELDITLQMHPHQCWVEKNCLFWLADNSLSNAVQDTINFLCQQGTLTCVQAGVHQDPRILFCQSAFHLGGLQLELVPRAVPSRGRKSST